MIFKLKKKSCEKREKTYHSCYLSYLINILYLRPLVSRSGEATLIKLLLRVSVSVSQTTDRLQTLKANSIKFDEQPRRRLVQVCDETPRFRKGLTYLRKSVTVHFPHRTSTV